MKCGCAAACIRGKDGLQGTVKLIPQGSGTLVVAEIRGLPQSETGFFSLHIHEGQSCGGTDFAGSGGHFDPGRDPHPCHAGDLPPLLSAGGCAYLAVHTNRFRPEDVIGRTVVIHESPDDFRSQPAGNSGKKIACGILRPQ